MDGPIWKKLSLISCWNSNFSFFNGFLKTIIWVHKKRHQPEESKELWARKLGEKQDLKKSVTASIWLFFGISSKWLLFLVYSNCVSFLPFLIIFLPFCPYFPYSLLSLFFTFLILYFPYSLLSLFLSFLIPSFFIPFL